LETLAAHTPLLFLLVDLGEKAATEHNNNPTLIGSCTLNVSDSVRRANLASPTPPRWDRGTLTLHNAMGTSVGQIRAWWRIVALGQVLHPFLPHHAPQSQSQLQMQQPMTSAVGQSKVEGHRNGHEEHEEKKEKREKTQVQKDLHKVTTTPHRASMQYPSHGSYFRDAFCPPALSYASSAASHAHPNVPPAHHETGSKQGTFQAFHSRPSSQQQAMGTMETMDKMDKMEKKQNTETVHQGGMLTIQGNHNNNNMDNKDNKDNTNKDNKDNNPKNDIHPPKSPSNETTEKEKENDAMNRKQSPNEVERVEKHVQYPADPATTESILSAESDSTRTCAKPPPKAEPESDPVPEDSQAKMKHAVAASSMLTAAAFSGTTTAMTTNTTTTNAEMQALRAAFPSLALLDGFLSHWLQQQQHTTPPFETVPSLSSPTPTHSQTIRTAKTLKTMKKKATKKQTTSAATSATLSFSSNKLLKPRRENAKVENESERAKMRSAKSTSKRSLRGDPERRRGASSVRASTPPLALPLPSPRTCGSTTFHPAPTPNETAMLTTVLPPLPTPDPSPLEATSLSLSTPQPSMHEVHSTMTSTPANASTNVHPENTHEHEHEHETKTEKETDHLQNARQSESSDDDREGAAVFQPPQSVDRSQWTKATFSSSPTPSYSSHSDASGTQSGTSNHPDDVKDDDNNNGASPSSPSLSWERNAKERLPLTPTLTARLKPTPPQSTGHSSLPTPPRTPQRSQPGTPVLPPPRSTPPTPAITPSSAQKPLPVVRRSITPPSPTRHLPLTPSPHSPPLTTTAHTPTPTVTAVTTVHAPAEMVEEVEEEEEEIAEIAEIEEEVEEEEEEIAEIEEDYSADEDFEAEIEEEDGEVLEDDVLLASGVKDKDISKSSQNWHPTAQDDEKKTKKETMHLHPDSVPLTAAEMALLDEDDSFDQYSSLAGSEGVAQAILLAESDTSTVAASPSALDNFALQLLQSPPAATAVHDQHSSSAEMILQEAAPAVAFLEEEKEKEEEDQFSNSSAELDALLHGSSEKKKPLPSATRLRTQKTQMQQMQQSPRSQSSSASISLSASGESSSELFSNDDPERLEESFGGSRIPMTGTTMQMPDDLYEEDFD
jgi:hypothetical protein